MKRFVVFARKHKIKSGFLLFIAIIGYLCIHDEARYKVVNTFWNVYYEAIDYEQLTLDTYYTDGRTPDSRGWVPKRKNPPGAK